MEVHAPEHPIHTWRDFFVHLVTITVGLLIALALENAAEALHHRHIVREARENIRREIEDNQKQAQTNIGYLNANNRQITENLRTVQKLRADPHALDNDKHMSFAFTWSSFDRAAWLTARDSGALTYMPVAEVQRYADAYNQADLVNDQAVKIFTEQTDLAAPMVVEGGPQLNPQERESFLLECARVSGKLQGLAEITSELSDEYSDVLKH